MLGPCAAALRRAARGGEPPAELARKRLLLPTALVLLPVMLGFSALGVRGTAEWAARGGGDGDGRHENVLNMASIGSWFLTTFLAAFAAAVLGTRRLPLRWVEFFGGATALGIILLDWGAGQWGNGEIWACGILTMDVLLCTGAGEQVTLACLTALAMWVLVRSVEDTFRLGLYDFPYATGFAPKPGRPLELLSLSSCRLIPFLIDFWFTRTFVEESRGSVMLSQALAQALMRYDLSAAREVLSSTSAERLPPQLREAFGCIVDNLAEYRPYLPHTILDRETEASRADDIPNLAVHLLNLHCNESGSSSGSSSEQTPPGLKVLPVGSITNSPQFGPLKTPTANSRVSPMSVMKACPSNSGGVRPQGLLTPRVSRSTVDLPDAHRASVTLSSAHTFVTRTDASISGPRLARTFNTDASLSGPMTRAFNTDTSISGNRPLSRPMSSHRDQPQVTLIGLHSQRSQAKRTMRSPAAAGNQHTTASMMLDRLEQSTERNLAIGVVKKSISLVCVNIRSYHASGFAEEGRSESTVALHHAFVDMLLAARERKGTVDAVAGDRGRVAFNAAKGCAAHRAMAARCALQSSSAAAAGGAAAPAAVLLACADNHFGARGLELSVGAAAGAALVGTLGAPEMRGFNILATLCGWAHALERLSAQGFGGCLADAGVVKQAGALVLRAVPLRVLHFKHHHTPARVWSVEGERDDARWVSGLPTSSRELPEQPEREPAPDPFHALNAATDAYLEGDWGTARDQLRLAPQGLDAAEEMERLVAHAAARGAPPPTEVLFDAARVPPPAAALSVDAIKREAGQLLLVGDRNVAASQLLGASGLRDSTRLSQSGRLIEEYCAERAELERRLGAEKAQQLHQHDSKMQEKQRKRKLTAQNGNTNHNPPQTGLEVTLPSLDAPSATPPLRFVDVQEGMRIRMTPEGCDTSREFYIGVVFRVQRSGGFTGDLVYLTWNTHDDGGPPDDFWLGRPERRRWWDGDGRPQLLPPAEKKGVNY